MKKDKYGITLIELLVVVLIVGILSTMATTVYTKHIERAKIAKTKTLISILSMAINQYEIDTGQYPVSGSGKKFNPKIVPQENGSGHLYIALTASMNGRPTAPLSNTWKGPYVTFQDTEVGNKEGKTLQDMLAEGISIHPPLVQIFDAWDNSILYVRSEDYGNPIFGATKYPVGHPFAVTEIYYNPTTFQLISFGRDGNPSSDDLRNF